MEETGRGQFTFYASFARAVKRIRKAADRAAAYDAIVDYALYDIEPDMDRLSDTAAVAFEMARPNLDAARRKAENGLKGGRPKSKKVPESAPAEGDGEGTEEETKPKPNWNQSKTKPKPNGNQAESKSKSKKEEETENKIEKEVKGEGENECSIPSPEKESKAKESLPLPLPAEENQSESSACDPAQREGICPITKAEAEEILNLPTKEYAERVKDLPIDLQTQLTGARCEALLGMRRTPRPWDSR